MKLLIGLGNPGAKYKNNRHNVGHMFVDFFSKKCTAKDFLGLKSGDFMNSSGNYVVKALKFHKLAPEALFVVHDDLDIFLGEFKIQKGKGPKKHNGIFSVDSKIGTNYWRIRIGVDNRPNGQGQRIAGETYVLQDFLPEESRVLPKVFEKICERLKSYQS